MSYYRHVAPKDQGSAPGDIDWRIAVALCYDRQVQFGHTTDPRLEIGVASIRRVVPGTCKSNIRRQGEVKIATGDTLVREKLS